MDGKIVKYIRKALNLSQTELGELIGVSYLTVWRYEHDRQAAQPRTLRRMQKVLGYTEEDLVSIAELLDDEDNRRSHARLKTKLQQQLQQQVNV
ncbi:helix-turn-helix transcriptional regulator [Bacillus sp. ISL-40]|uniref:helix-turn-helix domain-containing protein n=1 Tax=unclassified Bacillus (in: firmicutes) TaxID=185979 RepID=UPI001BE62C91|nr:MULTISPECIES: helix-turn-helix transcriptional regulator [unclassified Bacillus (in: firmicutes)]MBT2697237.1 helix-turn-helix transcriptional regulator [Bacillus sp. ISL-40]MBT2741189.1 helix-turn-helix transcriptional regulator [Bacillus sp. ISL-77]